jgi:hypothetical protein
MVARVDPASVRPEGRSSPTDIDRERARSYADHAIRGLRDGLEKSLFDVHLSGLHGASIQRLYIKLVLRGLTRWLAETLTYSDLVTYAHHVVSQDGPPTALPDTAASTFLRSIARIFDER